MFKLFGKRHNDAIETRIDNVFSKYSDFSNSYEARKILKDMGFANDFVENVFDCGYSTLQDFDTWFKQYAGLISKNSKIYNLLKTSYQGGVENFNMNMEFSKMA